MILHLSEEIGSRLQEERKRFGMTQGEIAEAIGVVKRTQANYEAGTSDAPASYLSKLAVQFGFDVPYILTGVRTNLSESALNEIEDSLIKQYRIIPEDDQKAIRRFLRAMVDDVVKSSR
ncbi:helix-turn-helix domain-containing protein [Pseudomonas mercuritolerans]|uniref:Helix-turn-helix domain-containing protein n=1 Tax=Pseudomonas mercuritolerans TaxID=2951809 RepID=A0ABT2XPB8_9PSED|nr:helix-turn-helix transcriptional regulator [Pseudomonas mercuritolerans]MCV2220551.1 helix-turn-helix domain-containing protein [Pseudomonas mercuritolerans]